MEHALAQLPDRPSFGIPALNISTAFQLAQVMLERGDTTGAERFRRAALDMGDATHSKELFLPRAAEEARPAGGDTLRA